MSQLTQTAFESKYNNSSSGPFYNQTAQEITTTVIRAFAKDLADSVKFKGTYEALTGLQITQSSHGFVEGNVLTLDGSGVPTKISVPGAEKFIGIVINVIDANTYVLALPGSYVTGLTGLTAGTKYYAQTDGTIGTTDTNLPILLADTTTSGYVLSGQVEVSSPTLQATITLSAAQIKALGSSGITLVAAQGANTIIDFERGYYSHEYGSVAFDFPSQALQVQLNSTALNSGTDVSVWLNATADRVLFFNKIESSHGSGSLNAALILKMGSPSTDATTGDSTATVVIYYRVVTIS